MDDPRLPEAKAKPVDDVVGMLKLFGLRKSPDQKEWSGPCPRCGDAGHDPKSGPPNRFNINRETGAFFCRKCDIRGGDVVKLVQEAEGLTFPAALSFLVGDLPETETPEQKAAREKRAAAARARLEADEKARADAQAKYRARSVKVARDIWRRSQSGDATLARAYLTSRRIGPEWMPFWPPALRFIADHPRVMETGKDERGRKVYTTIYRGPCMIAGILDQRGDLTAVHQTWIDPNPPHGKAVIIWDGTAQESKIVRGTKRGGAIRLHQPEGAETLVMGEGIETTLSALAADAAPGAAYWAGVDLGNMAGRMMKVEGKRHSGLPDMEDDRAFVPPPWVRRLVYIQDGDSDPKATRAKLEAGLRRAMALRPGLVGQIVHAGAGVDLNDVLQGKVGEVAREDTQGEGDGDGD